MSLSATTNEEEIDYPVKPMKIGDKEKFEKLANEMLTGWKEFKNIEKRMKLLDASCKDYMLKNNMDNYKCNNGVIAITKRMQNRLDRTLINDIELYMVESEMNFSYKFPINKETN